MKNEPSQSRPPVARAARMTDLLDLSYEPIVVWRLDGQVVSWNAAAERLYGFSPEEALGQISHALLRTRFPIEPAELISRLRTHRYWSGELHHTCRDGREVIVDSRMQLLDDGSVLEANRDVTEIRALAARQATLMRELSAAAAKFAALFNQSGIFAGIMDLQGYLREANNLSLEACGYTRQQVLDKPFWETPWWRGSEEVKARIRFATEQAAKGLVFREELPFWLGDGRGRIVDFAMHPIFGASGSVMFLHPSGIDITERKQAEAALRDSEQRLRWIGSVVESSDDAIVSKDSRGIISSWNRGAERLFGYSAQEALGQPITLIIPDELLPEERMILARISQGEGIDHFETVRRRKDGSLVSISLTASPVKDAEGKIVGASKIARDITEQKRSREHIGILAREAEHRSKNILSNVQAIVNLSQSDSPEGLKQAISGRLQAMSNVHSLFVEARWVGAEVSAIARQELAPYLDDHEARVRIEGPQTVLEPNAAQAVAVVLHELATNASKYGALSERQGRIGLAWSCAADGSLTFRWSEAGGPSVSAPDHRGFGGLLIERTVGQLGGTTRFDWRAEGLSCEVILPAVPRCVRKP
jgi:PAS domain S-box-containing protein